MNDFGNIAIIDEANTIELPERYDLVVTNCGFYSSSNAFSDLRQSSSTSGRLIVYQHKGNASLKIKNKQFDIPAGTVFITPAETASFVVYKNDEVNERYYIYFCGTKINAIFNELNLHEIVYNVGNFKEFIDAVNLLLDDFSKNKNNNLHFKNILLLNVLARLNLNLNGAKNNTSELKAIQPALNNMQKNFKKKILAIDDYAEMCFVSKATFLKKFKKELNITPTKYFYNLKIENAKLQLINSHKQINEIAFDLSFADALYFSRVFKMYTGLSPKQFRKKLK